MKITGLTMSGVSSAIAERVAHMDINNEQTLTLIIEPESRDAHWLLISVEVEDELHPS